MMLLRKIKQKIRRCEAASLQARRCEKRLTGAASLRGALSATKQSSFFAAPLKLDCFVAESAPRNDAAPVRRFSQRRSFTRGLIVLFSITSSISFAASPPNIGNFALPASQEPGPFISFGQNIIAKNETILFVFADSYVGVNKRFSDIYPALIYGFTDNFSIYIAAPYALYQTGNDRSYGFEDAFAQLEYAFYSDSTSTYTDLATVAVNMTYPSGSTRKNPSTGVGSPSFFLGTTFNRTYVDWYFFTSPGAIFTTARNGTKYGNTYLYQFGVGKNISDKNGWILAWLVEADGTYVQKNRVEGILDNDSGGNYVFVTPSFWASSKELIIQLGLGFPATQHLFGNQTKYTYLLAAAINWSIY